MNTKWKLTSSVFTVLLLVALFTACGNRQDEHNHSNEHKHSDIDISIQAISPNKQVLSNQATVKLQSAGIEKTAKSQGFIVPAQNRNHSVAARFGGRIEKLYVRFGNQYVKQGDKIMEIYSPNLRTFQQEHLFLLKSNADTSLIKKSREKLRLLGITENQIAQLEKKGTVASVVSVFSPVSGYVFFNNVLPQENTGAKNKPAMNNMDMQKSTGKNSYGSSISQIREGVYVNEGQVLFTVNDLQEVWALVSVDDRYINNIQENQSVEIVSENAPSTMLRGTVALTEQIFEEDEQRFTRVRVVLSNSNQSLKINSLVTAQFVLNAGEKPQLPTSAVYKTGLNAYVWVKTDTTPKGTAGFRLRKVSAGASSNGMTIINGGLLPDEEIAIQSGLMADSETFFNAD